VITIFSSGGNSPDTHYHYLNSHAFERVYPNGKIQILEISKQERIKILNYAYITLIAEHDPKSCETTRYSGVQQASFLL